MDSRPYNHCADSADELAALRQNPTIQMYASMKEDLLEVVTHSNPTLCMFVHLAKKIMADREE